MASIKKVGKVWRVQIAIKGVREHGSFRTKAEADAYAARRETEIRNQRASGVVHGKKVIDAFDRYMREVSSTKRGKVFEIRRLNALRRIIIDGTQFGEIALSELAPNHLSRLRDIRLSGSEDRKPVIGSTVNREFNLLSHVFSIAAKEWGWLQKNPLSSVRRPKEAPPRDRRVTDDEIGRLCLALDFTEEVAIRKNTRVAIAFLFAIETAMRAGEICSLTRANIDGPVAHLLRTKNGGKRDVALSTRALELLSFLPVCDDDQPIFGLTESLLDALFRKARERCDIFDLHFHDTRHEAITRLAKKLNVLELARMVGHRDLRQLQVYYNETADEIARKLD